MSALIARFGALLGREPAPLPRLSLPVFGWCVAAGLAALLPLGLQLSGWLGPLLLLLGLAGAGAGLRGAHIPAWLRLLLTLGVAGVVLYIYGFKFGRDTGAGLLATMLALKLLETNTLRDARALLSFSLFAIMAAFLQDQGPLTLLLALLSAVLILTALARVSEIESGSPTEAPGLARRLRATGLLMLLSLPLAAVGFLLFPRLPQPLWGLPENSDQAKTGLSDRMSPGDILNLIGDDTPVLRVEFIGARPEEQRLYWRGPVLTQFDGRTWAFSPWLSQPQPLPSALREGERFRYRMTQEPNERHWVVGLDAVDPRTLAATEGLQLLQDDSVVSARRLTDVMRFELESTIEGVVATSLSAHMRRQMLRLPEEFNPQTLALVQGWQAEGLDDDALVSKALELFNREFSYSLSPAPLGRHSVDEFMFQTREGFCEHFASAFTVMMRMAGIPARVVTGYQGGFYNPIGDYVLVRQSDAHAWSEIWMDERGWVRIDPTAAVSPQRIEGGNSIDAESQSGWKSGLGPLLDAADWLRHGWNTLVLGFNAARQRSLLLSFGIDASDWRELGLALAGAFGLALALTLWLVLRGGPRSADPLVAAWLLFCRRLGKLGIERRADEAPLSFGRRAAAALPRLAADLLELTRAYSAQRYAADADDAERARLIRALRAFRPRRHRATVPSSAPTGVKP